eukprot:1518932-Rhodomonas_salina.1
MIVQLNNKTVLVLVAVPIVQLNKRRGEGRGGEGRRERQKDNVRRKDAAAAKEFSHGESNPGPQDENLVS